MAGTIHLVGIGGVGMSALAQAYLDAGHAVSGADRSLRADGSRTPVLDALAAEGVRLFPDDGSGIDGGTERLELVEKYSRAKAEQMGMSMEEYERQAFEYSSDKHFNE